MKQIFHIFCALSISFILLASCHRRELTYSYTPTVEVKIIVDWSNMSTLPTGMSVYCYPDDGSAPTIKQTNDIDSTTVNLGLGTYKILIFNQVPSDFGSIDFSGLTSYETAAVYTVNTTSRWYESKAEETLVRDPDELAASTYHDLEIPQSAIDEVLGLQQKAETSSTIDTYITINVTPKVVVRTTRVTVGLDGIYNLSSVRATLYGMSTGYNFSEQKSHSEYATHLLEAWTATKYDYDVTQGEIVTYFTCFGLPETTTQTRSIDETWEGSMHLELLLVDDSTVVETDHILYDKTTILNADDLSDDDRTSTSNSTDYEPDTDYEDSDIDISIDITEQISLPDVTPTDGSSGGFNATVSDWEDEEKVLIDM